MQGVNDLASRYPDIAEEWDYECNGDLLPTEVLYSSAKRAHWKCSRGHRWEARIGSRTDFLLGCPQCGMSSGEKVVSKALEKLQVKYEYDVPLPGCKDKRELRHDFILFNSRRQIIGTIEFNGQQHYNSNFFVSCSEQPAEKLFEKRQRRDRIKTEYLFENGIPQLIIPYYEIKNVESLVTAFIEQISSNKNGISLKALEKKYE